MQIHFLRHATLILKLPGAQILVDPMLSPAEAMEPVRNAVNQKRIPMVGLPLSDVELNAMLSSITGVVVSHIHRDHWDQRSIELLPKALPILCQPQDESTIRAAGFKEVTPIQKDNELLWQGMAFHRTGGQHGLGELGKRMGPVSGFVVRAKGEPTVYIAGDTVWCPQVANALETFAPDIVILNAGEARFLTSKPITMNAADVSAVCRARPSARVVAIHMETVNHCVLTRDGLSRALEKQKLVEQVLIPADGAVLTF
jgi:L-ascorbate metabolism protein UlaG (beta-lactamase superfamily)